MVGLVFQNFVSPAIGLAVAAALARGMVREGKKTIGSFWVDVTRAVYYLLLPLAVVLAIVFVAQGVPQNFSPYAVATTLENQTQIIVQGPIASQEAIKILGTNGGGFTNVNSSHPYENPTLFTNLIQILAILAIPAAQIYYYGLVIGNKKHGWALYAAVMMVFVVRFVVCFHGEAKGNPLLTTIGIENFSGNMEGKEMRFSILPSALFAAATTSASNGAVNEMHDSFTPLSGGVLMLFIQLGEVIWGGVGAGLFSLLIFVLLSVFTAGLIIGRTPEYLGKKIEAYDVKLTLFTIMPYMLAILGFTAWAAVSPWGVAALGNSGAHGFSEILYAFSSATGNNGSAFAGLSTNTPIWDVLLAIAMLAGRFIMIVPVLALADSFARKQKHPVGIGSFPIHGPTFVLLLIGIIVLLGALSYLPALVMGPFIEQFYMNHLQAF